MKKTFDNTASFTELLTHNRCRSNALPVSKCTQSNESVIQEYKLERHPMISKHEVHSVRQPQGLAIQNQNAVISGFVFLFPFSFKNSFKGQIKTNT